MVYQRRAFDYAEDNKLGSSDPNRPAPPAVLFPDFFEYDARAKWATASKQPGPLLQWRVEARIVRASSGYFIEQDLAGSTGPPDDGARCKHEHTPGPDLFVAIKLSRERASTLIPTPRLLRRHGSIESLPCVFSRAAAIATAQKNIESVFGDSANTWGGKEIMAYAEPEVELKGDALRHFKDPLAQQKRDGERLLSIYTLSLEDGETTYKKIFGPKVESRFRDIPCASLGKAAQLLSTCVREGVIVKGAGGQWTQRKEDLSPIFAGERCLESNL